MRKLFLVIVSIIIAASFISCDFSGEKDVIDTEIELRVPFLPEVPELTGSVPTVPDQGEITRMCLTNPMDGYWFYYYPTPPCVRRVIYEQVCVDVIYCDMDGNCSNPDGRDMVRIFGACCGNTCECDWGVSRVNDYNSYWSYAVYNYSNWTTYAWFHYYETSGVLLVVSQFYYTNGNFLERYDFFNKYAEYGNVD